MDHNEEHCLPVVPNEQEGNMVLNNDQLLITRNDDDNQKTGKPPSNPENTEDFVSWMLVKKPIRKRTPRPEKNPNQGATSTMGGPVVVGGTGSSGFGQQNRNIQAEKGGSGSRFSVLFGADKVVTKFIKI